MVSDQGRDGGKEKAYATLSIAKDAARGQIEYQKGKSERAKKIFRVEYASRLTTPTVAYL